MSGLHRGWGDLTHPCPKPPQPLTNKINSTKHSAESVMGEFGLTWVNERQLAQACAGARNTLADRDEAIKILLRENDELRKRLVLDEAKIEAAWAALIGACGLDAYDEYGRPLASPYINCVEIDDVRTALLAAGFTERVP